MSERIKIFILFTLLLPALSEAKTTRLDPWNGISDVAERIETIQSLCASLKYNYAGWELKKRIKLNEGYLIHRTDPRGDESVANGEEICNKAIESEKLVLDPNSDDRLSVAAHNLQFSDRIRALGASFKDSHLVIDRNQNRTFIKSGIFLTEINHRYYVSSIPTYVSRLVAADQKLLPKKGDEILSWGGRSVDEAMSELYPFISASSERALQSYALSALTSRSFHYPKSGKVRIEWRTPGTELTHDTELPWIFGTKSANDSHALNEDDFIFLKSISAIERNAAFEKMIQKNSADLSISEIRFDDIALQRLDGNVQHLRRVYDASGNLIAQQGVFGNNMWIQIQSFSDWTVGATRPETKVLKKSLSDYLAEWVARAASEKKSIILDLRFNPGGNPALSEELASIFLPENRIGVPFAKAIVMSSSNRQSFLQMFQPELKMQSEKDSDREYEQKFSAVFIAALEKEKNQKLFMSPVYREKHIESKMILKSIVPTLIWTGPECASACEIAVMLFAKNNLSKVMGTTTSGTGMGVTTQSIQESAGKITDLHQTHASDFVPNFYFGPPSITKTEQGVDPEMQIDRRVLRISENRPMEVDLPYEDQLIDLTHNGLGWLQASERYFAAQKK